MDALRPKFMESPDAKMGAYGDHEPEMHKSLEINGRIFRFMESPPLGEMTRARPVRVPAALT